jgi:S-adenosylmethionine-diacylglycerol 3-amino-3-carboxypropyl transferase
LFARNFYRHGLLGHFIGLSHAVARAYGVNPIDLLRARSLGEQRSYFETAIAPLFDKRLVRWATALQVSLFGLGIPPAQFSALASAGGGNVADALRDRLQKLTCEFSLKENYFAWQAFGRAYAENAQGPLPPYLQRAQFDAVRSRAGRVEVNHRSLTEHLERCPENSIDRFVLLDAQDWMSDTQLNALWTQITRTARPAARVIFRTAAEPSPLPGRLDDTILARWHYRQDISRDLTMRDRSAIYGGFHLYRFIG